MTLTEHDAKLQRIEETEDSALCDVHVRQGGDVFTLQGMDIKDDVVEEVEYILSTREPITELDFGQRHFVLYAGNVVKKGSSFQDIGIGVGHAGNVLPASCVTVPAATRW